MGMEMNYSHLEDQVPEADRNYIVIKREVFKFHNNDFHI